MNNLRYYLKKYLPAIFLILFLIFFFFYRYIEKRRDLSVGLLWAKQDSLRVADSLKRIEVETKLIDGTNQDSNAKTDKERLPELGGEFRDTYYIIVGSFTYNDNAKLAAAKYRDLGYKANIISATNRDGIKTELVSVNTFNNFNEAVRYLRELREKFEPEAWLYSNN